MEQGVGRLYFGVGPRRVELDEKDHGERRDKYPAPSTLSLRRCV